MSNDLWLTRLRAAYHDKTGASPNRLKIPSEIDFSGTGDRLHMRLADGFNRHNMQSDAAAFEGWALVFRTWLELKDVELDWGQTVDGRTNDQRFEQFLYRASRFSRNYESWFSVANSFRLEASAIDKSSETLFLNMASDRSNLKETQTPRRNRKEHELEKTIVENSTCQENLKALLGLSYKIDRQFPVGVFEGRVSRSSQLLPGGSAQIDLWSIDAQRRFIIFELKTGGNVKVGILSQLFYYSTVVSDLQRNIFHYESMDQATNLAVSSDGVRGCLLAPRFHPLVATGDHSVFGVMNASEGPQGGRIEFCAIQISETGNGPTFNLRH